MKKKILIPIILGMLTVFSLSSCGEKAITAQEASVIYQKVIDEQKSSTYKLPNTYLVKTTFDRIVQDEKATIVSTYKYDSKNFYAFSEVTMTSGELIKKIVNYTYIKDNSFYSYLKEDEKVTASKTTLTMYLEQVKSDILGTALEGVSICDVSYLEGIKTDIIDVAIAFKDAHFYSKGEGSLIIDMAKSATEEEVTTSAKFDFILENYRLVKLLSSMSTSNGIEITSSIEIEYDTNVISYLNESVFTK